MGTRESVRTKEEIMMLVGNLPQNVDAIREALDGCALSETDLMEIAIKAVTAYEDVDCNEIYWRTDEEGEHYRIAMKYDKAYVDGIRNHKLIKILQLLLDYGLDPNTCLESWPNNVMESIKYLDPPFLAGFCTKVLMENGADPWIETDEKEYLFEELDADVCIDIGIQPDRMVQPFVQCWFVMVGYGARPRNVEPFKLNPSHSYDELKEFEFFEYNISYDRDKQENIMHIIDTRTGEEIGCL